MEELNKKLAEENFELRQLVGEWTEFIWQPYKALPTGEKLNDSQWLYPDGTTHYALPNFPYSLDTCFKWLVPNHKIPIRGISFRYFPGGTECELTYMTEAGFETVTSWIQAESKCADYDGEAFRLSALALCKAIEQLIDKEEVKQ